LGNKAFKNHSDLLGSGEMKTTLFFGGFVFTSEENKKMVNVLF
jgi:hypothetical protein